MLRIRKSLAIDSEGVPMPVDRAGKSIVGRKGVFNGEMKNNE